jgi:hypothetical protein
MHVDVLVYGGAEHSAAIALVIGWDVRAASEEADADG